MTTGSSSTSSFNGRSAEPRGPEEEVAGLKTLLTLFAAKSALAALALILIAEGFVFANRTVFMSAMNNIVLEKKKILTDPAHADDVAILCTSVGFSFTPSVVSESLGGNLKVTNYAWPEAGYEIYDLMLEAYLEIKDPPKLLVAGLIPAGFGVKPELMRMKNAELTRTRAYNILPTFFLMRKMAARREWFVLWDHFSYVCVPPSVRHRDRIKSVAFSILKGGGVPQRDAAERRMLSDMRDKGAFLLYDKETFDPGALEAFEKTYGKFKLYSNEPPPAIEPFLERANRHGITVLLVNPPVPLSQYERLRETGVLDFYASTVERWKSEYPNIHSVEPLVVSLPERLFGDVGHLNAEGDKVFQSLYSEALRSWARDHNWSAPVPIFKTFFAGRMTSTPFSSAPASAWPPVFFRSRRISCEPPRTRG